MAFFLNELSLHNQFHNPEEFLSSLRLLWGCKELLRRAQYSLNCSRIALGSRPIINGLNFRGAVGNLQNRDLQRIILRWVDQEGPFWDDDLNRVHSPDEYYANEADEIVTDTALAEAAYLTCEGQNSSVVSFFPSNYVVTPIIISWYQTAESRVDISVSNYWEIGELEKLLATLAPPIQSWEQLKNIVQANFNNLTFFPGFGEGLRGQPFSPTIAIHVIHLLSILDELKSCFDEKGERSARGHEIYQKFFTGEKSKFSDESDTNKKNFKRELTFTDLDGEPLFCPYHGKISHQFYRIHFSWPITKDTSLFIAYIGPKITKG